MQAPPREEDTIRREIAHAEKLVEESSAANERIATARNALNARLRQVERAIRRGRPLDDVRNVDKLHSLLLAALACVDENDGGSGILYQDIAVESGSGKVTRARLAESEVNLDILNLLERAAPGSDDPLRGWRTTFGVAREYEQRLAALGQLEDELSQRRAGPGEPRLYLVLGGVHGRFENGRDRAYGPGSRMLLNAFEAASKGAQVRLLTQAEIAAMDADEDDDDEPLEVA